MKKITLILTIFVLFLSCSDNDVKSVDKPYSLSVKSQKAYEFYKSAKLKSQRGDFIG